MEDEVCPGCGVRLRAGRSGGHVYLGASPSCWSAYETLLAREYGDPAYMRVHRMTVDAYCAQHPGVAERRTVQSINVHLVGLHLSLERNMPGEFARKVIGIVADSLVSRLEWLAPPTDPGSVVVLHPLAAEDADAHGRLVHQWAASVWTAWRAHHSVVAQLADEALMLV